MGSEIIFLLSPIGVLVLGLLLYWCFRPGSRLYAATALVVGLTTAAAYSSGSSTEQYVSVFFLLFLLAAVLTGLAAIAVGWLITKARTGDREDT